MNPFRNEPQPAPRIEIRVMTRDDLDAVIDLHLLGGLTPWPRLDFEGELSRPENVLLVAVEAAEEGGIAGTLSGRMLLDEFEIFDVVVAAERRRLGIGAALVREALSAARSRGATRALLEVRAGNAAAIHLYQRFNFRQAGARKGYYQHPAEDALLMVCDSFPPAF